MNNTEHRILRLPPYHCFYNAIEMSWGIAKRFYDKNIGYKHKYNDERTKTLWQQGLDQVTPAIWNRMCDKVDRKITRHYNRYVLGLTKEQRAQGEGLMEHATKSPPSTESSPGSENETKNKPSGQEMDILADIMNEVSEKINKYQY